MLSFTSREFAANWQQEQHNHKNTHTYQNTFFDQEKQEVCVYRVYN